MLHRKGTSLLAVAIAGFLTSPVLAQAANQDKSAANPAAAAETAPGGMPMQGHGMMGRSMTGQGMTGQGMMGQGMMGQGMMGQGMMGQGGMAMMGARHVEGRIAFLKTEIKITDAQEKLWDVVAGAMRANAKAMTALHAGMMATATPTSLPDRLAAAEQRLEARLSALQQYKASVDPLYAALSSEQKKTADELMPGMMGLGMGPGMGMGGGMMGRMGMR